MHADGLRLLVAGMFGSRRGFTVALLLSTVMSCLPCLAIRGVEDAPGDHLGEEYPSILITRPEEGENVQGYKVVIQYTSRNAPGTIAILFDGVRIATTQEAQATLEIPEGPFGQHYVEVHVLSADEKDIVASDGVDLFILGDGVMGPDGLDDDGIDVDDVKTGLSAGREHEEAGNLDQAHTEYARVIGLLGNAPGPWVPSACIGLGRVRALNGDLAGALLAMRDAVWHTPESAEAHAWIAYLVEEESRIGLAQRGDESELIRRHLATAWRLRGEPFALPKLSSFPRARDKVLRVGILTVGSGAYAQFFRPNAEAAERYLLRGVAELHHFVFTDRVQQVTDDVRSLRAWSDGRIHITKRAHDGWPSASMKRAHTYFQFRSLWSEMDYVFAVDVDTLCVCYIGSEILGETVGTLHADNAMYLGVEVAGMSWAAKRVQAPRASMWRQHHGLHAMLTGAVYERRSESVASIPVGAGTHYFAGGFYGGKSVKVATMLAKLVEYTDKDIENGIVAKFHDESQINRYWLENPPAVILTCAYLYPEPTMEPCWGYSTPHVQDSNLHHSQGTSAMECVRDHGHPWLWSPWKPSTMNGENEQWSPSLWGSHRRFAIRLLNLSKDKWKLINDGDAHTD